MSWKEYLKKETTDDNTFLISVISEKVSFAMNDFEENRTGVTKLDAQCQDNFVQVTGAAKVWMEKSCNNKRFIVPGIIFGIETILNDCEIGDNGEAMKFSSPHALILPIDCENKKDELDISM